MPRCETNTGLTSYVLINSLIYLWNTGMQVAPTYAHRLELDVVSGLNAFAVTLSNIV